MSENNDFKYSVFTRRVFLASPYSGNWHENMAYLKLAIHDCLRRREAPFASHALYPQFLNDSLTVERDKGIQAALMFLPVCHALVAYVDLGISEGMEFELQMARNMDVPVERRRVG